MSMNHAEFCSAFEANLWTAFWVYLTAPLLRMLGAAEFYRLAKDHRRVCWAAAPSKNKRCIFRCKYSELRKADGRVEPRWRKRRDCSVTRLRLAEFEPADMTAPDYTFVMHDGPPHEGREQGQIKMTNLRKPGGKVMEDAIGSFNHGQLPA